VPPRRRRFLGRHRALKSRSIPAAEAVRQSLAALDWLKAQGCRQFLFKYCSTFDSTPEGNIGPVAEALAEALAADRVVVCPAFPSLGRTLHQGHLFVGDRLLSESGMERHPLNPMTDPDSRRGRSSQCRGPLGHVPSGFVLRGAAAFGDALVRCRDAGERLVVVDAVKDADLVEIGAALADLPLVTGGSGVALGLPDNFRRTGLVERSPPRIVTLAGPCVILSGSCSAATRAQVAEHRRRHPALEVRPGAVMAGEMTAAVALDWTRYHREGLPLVFSSADPASVESAQAEFGRDAIAGRLEAFFGELAALLASAGVERIVSAGGETSGAVVGALGIDAMEIGPEIDPGVPALRVPGRPLALALKSGNFGGADFFGRAAAALAPVQGTRSQATSSRAHP
jgi:uncharacterized protein YgbK (DUF1537 family)